MDNYVEEIKMLPEMVKFTVDIEEQKKEYIEILSKLYKLKDKQRFEIFTRYNAEDGKIHLNAITTKYNGMIDKTDLFFDL